MWMHYPCQESQENRRKRLFASQKNKAKHLNNRMTQFIKNVRDSSFYKESEKDEILSNFKILDKITN